MKNKKSWQFTLFVILEFAFILLLTCFGFFDITLFSRESLGWFFAFVFQALGYIIILILLSVGTYFLVPKLYRCIKYNEINVAITIICISNVLVMVLMIVLKITVLPLYRLDRIIWMTIINILRILIANGFEYSGGKSFCENCNSCFCTREIRIKTIGSPETRTVKYQKYEKVGEIIGDVETDINIDYEHGKAKSAINADIMGYVNHSHDETTNRYRYRVECDNCGCKYYYDRDETTASNYK